MNWVDAVPIADELKAQRSVLFSKSGLTDEWRNAYLKIKHSVMVDELTVAEVSAYIGQRDDNFHEFILRKPRVTVGEVTFLMSRFGRVFEMFDDDEESYEYAARAKLRKYGVMIPVIRKLVKKHEAMAWMVLLHTIDFGDDWEKGLKSIVTEFTSNGMRFDDVIAYFRAGVSDSGAIIQSFSNDVDPQLAASLN